MSRKSRKGRTAKKSDENDPIYYVEAIVGKRVVVNQTQYLVKWLDFPDSENTWEPLSHLKSYDCDEFIESYESALIQNRPPIGQQLSTIADCNAVLETGQSNAALESAIDCGCCSAERKKKVRLRANRILGATDSDGELMFLVGYGENDEKQKVVAASKANLSFPHIVIEFYEKCIQWRDEKRDKVSDEVSDN